MAMASSSTIMVPLLLLLLLSSFLSFAAARPLYAHRTFVTIRLAAEALSQSGQLSMALALQLAATADISLGNQTVTIFAPPDSAFLQSQPPSLALLRSHISPQRVVLESLRRDGTLETLRENHKLMVTSSIYEDGFTAVNGVPVDRYPVLDNGFISIYLVAALLNGKNDSTAAILADSVEVQSFGDSAGDSGVDSDEDSVKDSEIDSAFLRRRQLGDILRAWDCRVFAVQVESQFGDLNNLTLFRVIDDDVESETYHGSDYALQFQSRLVTQRLGWHELSALKNGTLLRTVAGSKKRLLLTKREGGLVVLNDEAEVVGVLYESPEFVMYLLRFPGRRHTGFLSGGCYQKPPELTNNIISWMMNVVFSVFAILLVFWIVVMFCHAANASFKTVEPEDVDVVCEAGQNQQTSEAVDRSKPTGGVPKAEEGVTKEEVVPKVEEGVVPKKRRKLLTRTKIPPETNF